MPPKRKSEGPDEQPPVKRPRGRPPKKKKEALSDSSGDALSLSSASTPTAEDSDVELVEGATQELLGRGGSSGRSSSRGVAAGDGDEDFEEEDDDDEEEEESLGPLDVVIPLQNKEVDDHEVPLDTEWTDFLEIVAESLDIRTSSVQMAYKLSTEKAGDAPHALGTKKQYKRLIKAATEELRRRAALAPSKQPKTAYKVLIIDKREIVQGAEVEKTGKGKGSGKPASKTKKRTRVPDDDEPTDAADQKPTTSEEHMAKLREALWCDKHKSLCICTKEHPEHIEVSDRDSGLWTVILAAGKHHSYTTPPAVLGLNVAQVSRMPPPSRRQQTRDYGPRAGPYGRPPPPGYHGYTPYDYGEPYGYAPYGQPRYGWPGPGHDDGHHHAIDAPSRGRRDDTQARSGPSRRDEEVFGGDGEPPVELGAEDGNGDQSHGAAVDRERKQADSTDAEKAPAPVSRNRRKEVPDFDRPTIYPMISDWLKELDADPDRGADNRNFGQFTAGFAENGLHRLHELEDETAVTLVPMFGGAMNRGTAKVLLGYVKKDLAASRAKEEEFVAFMNHETD
ncbi:hypothetical protein MKEN_00948300 [Mycena kentingensis (nom. inval.)]|nr:hypothetical protein MKEN_00948300 [Mycena kentingensis (nom. inval.)]